MIDKTPDWCINCSSNIRTKGEWLLSKVALALNEVFKDTFSIYLMHLIISEPKLKDFCVENVEKINK